MFQSLIQKTKILSTSLNIGFGALARKITGEFKPLPLTASWHDDYTLPNKLPGNLKYKRRNKKKHRGKVRKERVREPSENIAKPVQKWWDYDGIGRYKSRYHKFQVNMMLRDTQNRRVFEKYNQERVLVNSIWKNDILPKELRDFAYDQVFHMPRAAQITRLNRRCTVTGRARGNFHQFRVSRFIFRNEADAGRLSGAMRAYWMKGSDIQPNPNRDY